MKEYLDLVRNVYTNGILKSNRTKIKSLSIFGYQIRLNLMRGFPLLTTKKCNFRSIVYELLWMISGNTNVKFLQKNGISIWNHWADKDGNLGPLYGKQWRSWKGNNSCIDQLKKIIVELKNNPDSRRIILSSWNVGELNEMALAPCHVLAQFYVSNKTLSCHVYQRSCDVFLGLPFNIASYSLLVHMLSQQCDFEIGDFIWTGGDVHIYENHLEQVNLQLKRIPYPLPTLHIVRRPKSLFNYTFEDFQIKNYNFHPAIVADIAV